MPLLDGSGNGDAVVMDSVPSVLPPAVDSLPDPATRRSASNRRQKIVVVGLGMVAISFMYVWAVEQLSINAETRDADYSCLFLVRSSSSRTQSDESMISLSLVKNHTLPTIESASRLFLSIARSKIYT